MPLKKLLFRPGVSREQTRYASEALGPVGSATQAVGGWYESEKVRFRSGTPEKIGGWQRISSYTYLGVCRSLWNWVTLGGLNLVGVGTNLKFYIERGGNYNDITPLRSTVTLTDPFTATLGSSVVTVAAPAHGCANGDFVTFNGATGLGGNITAVVLNAEYQITLVNPDVYTITVGVTATATDVAGSPGGGTVTAAYQINVGPATAVPVVGWGAGTWSAGAWGTGDASLTTMRLWSQQNYGQDLVFGPRGGGLYYWQNQTGLSERGALLNSLGGVVTISLGSPTVITGTNLFIEGTALQFGGTLPSGMLNNTTYYVFNVSGFSFNLLDSAGNLVSTSVAPPLVGLVASGSVGTMVASTTAGTVTVPLSGVVATGVLGGTSTVNLTLTGVSAQGLVGSSIANGKNITGVAASGAAGTVTQGGVTVALTGNSGYASVGLVAISGTVTAFISRIVDVPVVQNFIMVSDTSRFILTFGANDYGSDVQDPMLVRWSNQEDPYNWTPNATNQAGSIRLSDGSEIVTAIQTRQEIVVFTDSALYSLQYLGPPTVWGTQILASNISIYGQNSKAVASGVVYWMGVDKFYKYDGRVQTLRCDLRQHIFSDINAAQNQQVFAGTNEGFNEVWWFYCSQNSTVVDKYVVYNYAEDIWYYGTMGRTAWLDSGLRDYPLAATYSNNLVNHEQGNDDNETGTPVAIEASIGSSEFDIDDGHNFGFIWRVIPDLTFRNSTGDLTPQCTMTLIPMVNSGSGYTDPRSTAGTSSASIQRIASAPVEEFTGQLYMRVRGRQIIFKVESNRLGTSWQLGAPRIDIKSDGRR